MSFVFIRKRTKNYIVYLEYKDKETGKKIQKNMGSFDKKRDASKKLTELKDTIFKDDFIVPSALTMETFLLDFLEKHKINLSITTYNCYHRICKKYLIPMLGNYKIEELKPIHIQNYVDD
ncbi:MAG: N-terminal phage integrase SAM-like domain-containing protein, partial [Peptostreptococcaceae bacterium]